MKSSKTPFAVALIFAVLAALAFTACSWLPATQGELADIEAAQQDAAAGQATALEGAQEGNATKVVFGAVFSAVSSLAAAIGLSRRRRAKQILADKAAKLADAME